MNTSRRWYLRRVSQESHGVYGKAPLSRCSSCKEDAKSLPGQDPIEEDIQTVLRHPLSMPGSDGYALAPYGPLGNGKVHRRSYRNHAEVLGHYVRERKVIRLEEAIRKMPSFPAQKLGLQDRGLLREGMKADIVVFDPKTVRDTTTRECPYSYAEGICHVLVNGSLTIDLGEHTHAQAGQFLRKVTT